MKRFDLKAFSKVNLLIGLMVVKVYQEVYMQDYKSLTHSKYDCKYYIVFVPKFMNMKKTLFGKIRKYLKNVCFEIWDTRVVGNTTYASRPSYRSL